MKADKSLGDALVWPLAESDIPQVKELQTAAVVEMTDPSLYCVSDDADLEKQIVEHTALGRSSMIGWSDTRRFWNEARSCDTGRI